MEKHIKDVERLEKARYWFECICTNKKYIRYGVIAELCEIIGIFYKEKDNIKSLEYLLKSYIYYKQVYDYNKLNKNSLKSLILSIAEQSESLDYKKAVEFYLMIIEIYSEKGDIINVIKYYEKIGKLYFDNSDLELAKQLFEKIILIIGKNEHLETNLLYACEILNKITLIIMLKLEEINLN